MEVPDFLNTRLPLLSLRVRGAWKKDKIFQVIHGKQCIRTYSEYDGSAKGHLIKFQSKFAAAVWRWQRLSYNERRWFISRAAKLGLQISGYNYFISLYMRDKLEGEVGYPDPHHSSHEKEGADELNVDGLMGVLAEEQPSAGGGAEILEINIILNAFRIAKGLALAVLNIVKGMVDAFIDESGVDTGASVNQSYDSGGDYYSPAGYTPQYPTHDTAHVKATVTSAGAFEPWYTTDPAKPLTGTYSSNQWLSDVPTNQRFHIDLGSAKIIKRIYYENSHNVGGNTEHGAKNFTFWGSNIGGGSFDDLVWGNDDGWTLLTCNQNAFDKHTDSDVVDPKYITVTNSTPYRYYAFKIADNHGNLYYMGIRHVELQTGGQDMALVSEAIEAIAQPDEIRIVIMKEDVDEIIPNTNFFGDVSRDDGDNWVEVVLEKMVDYATGKQILSGVGNVSGQEDDKTCRCRTRSTGDIDYKIHGWGKVWK